MPQLVDRDTQWISMEDVLLLLGVTPAQILPLLRDGRVQMGRSPAGRLFVEDRLLSRMIAGVPVDEVDRLLTAWKPRGRRPGMLTLSAAAARLGLSTKRLRAEIRSGRIPAQRRGPGSRAAYDIHERDIIAWMPPQLLDEAQVFPQLMAEAKALLSERPGRAHPHRPSPSRSEATRRFD